ncbi:hypothetical protein [Streptomyces sp. SD18]
MTLSPLPVLDVVRVLSVGRVVVGDLDVTLLDLARGALVGVESAAGGSLGQGLGRRGRRLGPRLRRLGVRVVTATARGQRKGKYGDGRGNAHRGLPVQQSNS